MSVVLVGVLCGVGCACAYFAGRHLTRWFVSPKILAAEDAEMTSRNDPRPIETPARCGYGSTDVASVHVENEFKLLLSRKDESRDVFASFDDLVDLDDLDASLEWDNFVGTDSELHIMET